MNREELPQRVLFCIKLAGGIRYAFSFLFVYMVYQWWTMPPAWEMRCMLAVVFIADLASGYYADAFINDTFRKFSNKGRWPMA